jgi:hypothetical protein
MDEEEYLKLKSIVLIRTVYVAKLDRWKAKQANSGKTKVLADNINKVCHKIAEIDEKLDMYHHRLLK